MEQILYVVLNTQNNHEKGEKYRWTEKEPAKEIDFKKVIWVDHFYLDASNPKDLNRVLSTLYRTGERCRFYYGENGKLWGDSEAGRIGRTTGTAHIPIVVHNKRSMGGPALLDNSIIKIETTKGKKVLYDATQKQPKLIKPIDLSNEDEYSEFLTYDEAKEIRPDLDSDYDHLEQSEMFDKWCILEIGENKELYHISDFLRWDTAWTPAAPDWAKGYHGYKGDSYFSTVLIALTEDGEGYVLNRATV